MNTLRVEKKACASIPSKYGNFQLSLYTNNLDDKEHLAISFGHIENSDDILVRIHSECVTGDLLGSLRCDCGEQLLMSMEQISTAGRGLIIYLRQEGRGIGLISKLKAYNLQDQGADTIDANLKLGHKADERSYDIAACILKLLNVKSIRLLTNNPQKLAAIQQHQVVVNERIDIHGSIRQDNAFYLLTKVKRMHHFIAEKPFKELLTKFKSLPNDKPMITLSYAQSIDGSIAKKEQGRLLLSSQESLILTHKLRASHDGILVGINTILSDDPQLTVRLANGNNPQSIILDSTLRIPLSAKILKNSKLPIIFTSEKADPQKQEILKAMGVIIDFVDWDPFGKINLKSVMAKLKPLGIHTLMVEGGRRVITSFLKEKLVDKVVITIAPIFVGGKSVLATELADYHFPKLKNILQYKLGNDLIIQGDIDA